MLELETKLELLDDLDETLNAELKLKLDELDFKLELELELATETVELFDVELFETELTTELAFELEVDTTELCIDELCTELAAELTAELIEELDLTLEFVAAELELDFTDVFALLSDELESGIGLGPVPTVLDVLLAVEVSDAADDDCLLLLIALSFASELITADEFAKLEVFAVLDELIVVVDEFVAELTAGLLPVLLPFPPPPPPQALSEATVMIAPKNAIFEFTNM